MNREKTSYVGIPLVLALLLLGPPADLDAQEPEVTSATETRAARPAITLQAAIGLLTPLSDLTPEASTGSAGEIEPTLRLSTGWGVALGVTLSLSSHWGVGAHGTWSNTDVDLNPAGAPEGERRLGEADHVTVAAEVAYRLLESPLAEIVDPYVAAGVGLRHVSFSFEDARVDDATDPMVTVAAGVRASLGERYHWTLEVRDHLSVYEAVDADGQLQNDVTITVGIGAGL